MSVGPSSSWVRRIKEEEKTAFRDVKLGLDKVDGPGNVKGIGLERLITTTRGLSPAYTLRRMTPKNDIRKLKSWLLQVNNDC